MTSCICAIGERKSTNGLGNLSGRLWRLSQFGSFRLIQPLKTPVSLWGRMTSTDRVRSPSAQMDVNLTISVRFIDIANFGVDYGVEEYYTEINKVIVLCE